ncbi:Hypothetical predicted protein [Octopus vulgaris]|uniref:Uncharacterized protein n=1 Tax=Octopus vulgaris TaxID=6645 RepID=A0AA36AIH1_OCTVU|nr:Hypothetical predicted protein [Octopus vulgaris]
MVSVHDGIVAGSNDKVGTTDNIVTTENDVVGDDEVMGGIDDGVTTVFNGFHVEYATMSRREIREREIQDNKCSKEEVL